MTPDEKAPPGVDPTIPSVARMYDYYLGGKDNFAADREAAEKVIAISVEVGNDVRVAARRNREFLGRAVRMLAESGIRQFVDVGAGLPTQENVHEVVLRAAPDARVVYVDNDPIVLVHARALLAGAGPVPPGVAPVEEWRPGPGLEPDFTTPSYLGVVGRVP